MSESEDRIRLDRWLHHARVFRTRTSAADAISAGGIRVNGHPCRKRAQIVHPGDTITIATHGQVRVLKVLEPGIRRGPASEAAGLYEEISL